MKTLPMRLIGGCVKETRQLQAYAEFVRIHQIKTIYIPPRKKSSNAASNKITVALLDKLVHLNRISFKLDREHHSALLKAAHEQGYQVIEWEPDVRVGS